MPTFAAFGEFIFQTTYSPENFVSEREYEWPEQKVIEDLLRVQWTGDDSEELTLDVLFPNSCCNPNMTLNQLHAIAEDHIPRILVYGTGEVRGYFVIREIMATYQYFTPEGRLAATQFQLKLKDVPLKEIHDPLNQQLGHQLWGILMQDQPLIETQPASFGNHRRPSHSIGIRPIYGSGGILLVYRTVSMRFQSAHSTVPEQKSDGIHST